MRFCGLLSSVLRDLERAVDLSKLEDVDVDPTK